MIKHAVGKGILKKDKSIIIEPSSGNTGIVLAGISAVLGYKVEIVIPEKVSEETKNIYVIWEPPSMKPLTTSIPELALE